MLPCRMPSQKCKYWSHKGTLSPKAFANTAYRCCHGPGATVPPDPVANLFRYAWTGSPGMRRGMSQSMVAPNQKAST